MHKKIGSKMFCVILGKELSTQEYMYGMCVLYPVDVTGGGGVIPSDRLSSQVMCASWELFHMSFTCIARNCVSQNKPNEFVQPYRLQS